MALHRRSTGALPLRAGTSRRGRGATSSKQLSSWIGDSTAEFTYDPQSRSSGRFEQANHKLVRRTLGRQGSGSSLAFAQQTPPQPKAHASGENNCPPPGSLRCGCARAVTATDGILLEDLLDLRFPDESLLVAPSPSSGHSRLLRVAPPLVHQSPRSNRCRCDHRGGHGGRRAVHEGDRS